MSEIILDGPGGGGLICLKKVSDESEIDLEVGLAVDSAGTDSVTQMTNLSLVFGFFPLSCLIIV